jgi:hypothetical protein
MTRFASLTLLLIAAGCGGASGDDGSDDDIDLASEDLPAGDVGGKDDSSPGWSIAPTMHVGASQFGRADAGDREVHSLWIAGREDAPASLDVTVTAAHDDHDVRLAVLGPLVGGTRPVLAAGGYSQRERAVTLGVEITTTGEHLVIVGSFGLESETFYTVDARCASFAGDLCGGARVDILAMPKQGALVGTGTDGLIRADLGDVLADRGFDVELEVWASPPAQSWNRELVGVSVASGTQVNAIVPASVVAGDDLFLVVREAGGRVLDTGVVTRYAPEETAFARLDSILYGDLVSMEISGVVGYYEGVADMVLWSEHTGAEIARHTLHADLPGQVGMGFGAFDATFAPELVDEDGELNPNLPHNGELLAIGFIGGDGERHPLGCFEYCNDLSGMATCTGGPRACPAGAW